jgi:hypothetical protein
MAAALSKSTNAGFGFESGAGRRSSIFGFAKRPFREKLAPIP